MYHLVVNKSFVKFLHFDLNQPVHAVPYPTDTFLSIVASVGKGLAAQTIIRYYNMKNSSFSCTTNIYIDCNIQ